MLLLVTEHNMWEKEKFNYVLDLSKQDGGSVSQLMIFIIVANRYFEECKEEAKNQGHGSCFAASKYSFRFFDSYTETENYLILNSNGMNLRLINDSDYKNCGLMLDRVISFKKMESAMIAMRDKETNKLYKSFEDIFIAVKKTKTTNKNEKQVAPAKVV